MQQRQKEKVTFWELFVVAELFNNLLTIAQRQGTRQIEMKSNSTSSSRIKQLQAKSPNGMCQSVCVGVCKCLSCCVSLSPSCSYICLCMFSDILNQTCVEGIKLWEAHTHNTSRHMHRSIVRYCKHTSPSSLAQPRSAQANWWSW